MVEPGVARRPDAAPRGTRAAAAVAGALGAGLLVAKAVGTAAGRGSIGGAADTAAIVASCAAALFAVAATAAIFVRPGFATRALSASLVLAVVVDWLPTAPPRLLHLLPLLVAFALMVGRPSRGASRVATGPSGTRRPPGAVTGPREAGRPPGAGQPPGPGQPPGAGQPPGPGRPPAWRVAMGWLALLLHVLVGFPYLVSGLVAPGYGVAGLMGIWIGLLVLLLRLRPTRPLLALLVPPAALAIWNAVIGLGGSLLGWTA